MESPLTRVDGRTTRGRERGESAHSAKGCRCCTGPSAIHTYTYVLMRRCGASKLSRSSSEETLSRGCLCKREQTLQCPRRDSTDEDVSALLIDVSSSRSASLRYVEERQGGVGSYQRERSRSQGTKRVSFECQASDGQHPHHQCLMIGHSFLVSTAGLCCASVVRGRDARRHIILDIRDCRGLPPRQQWGLPPISY